jgi:hypothetical protein
MNLIEVADLFREVVEKCPELDGRNFVIMKVELPPSMTPVGYELVVRIGRGKLDKVTVEKLYDIAIREKLKIVLKPTSLYIFKEHLLM